MSKDNHHEMGTSVEKGRPAMLSLMQKGKMAPADVAVLRRELLVDRSPSRVEIEDLFGLDAVLRPEFDGWTDLLVEAVTDHLVWDLRPTGVLEESQARWLMAKVDASKTASSFAILINILDEAHRVPRWFESAVRHKAVATWPNLMSSIERVAAEFQA